MKKNIAAVLLLFLVLLCFFIFGPKNTENAGLYNFTEPITVGDASLLVDRVTTQAGWQLGLSGHAPLADNQGLLFVFDKPDFYGIWMKDMNFPIDVFWFDENGIVVTIKENFLPQSYPETAEPDGKSLFVLETSVGFAEREHIGIGDRMVFPK